MVHQLCTIYGLIFLSQIMLYLPSNPSFFFCSERGVNAILLEKDQLSAGTTWHSAGFFFVFLDTKMHSFLTLID